MSETLDRPEVADEVVEGRDLADRCFDLLRYDPVTGHLTNFGLARNRPIGAVSGYIMGKGYRLLSIDGVRLYAHRVAWLFSTGQWPKWTIDHINGIRDDNRIINLRDVKRNVNCQNKRLPTKANSTGYLGVTVNRSRGKFVAQISVNGKHIHVGHFSDPEIAHSAYVEAKRKYHEGNTL